MKPKKTWKEFASAEIRRQVRAGATPKEALLATAKAWNQQNLARTYDRPERTEGVSLRKVRRKKIGRVDGYDVVLVDGEAVRDHVHIDFTQGGNPARYGYVPKGEIWVEAGRQRKDQAATAVHELIETREMKRGKSYGKAHDVALEREAAMRKRSRGRPKTEAGLLEMIRRWWSKLK